MIEHTLQHRLNINLKNLFIFCYTEIFNELRHKKIKKMTIFILLIYF